MRVLVTRPAEDGARIAARLQRDGHEAILAPVLEIAATGAEIPQGAFDGVIITSAHAVSLMPGDAASSLRLTPLFVVGERSAAAARQIGFSDIRAVAADSRDLAGRIIESFEKPARLLYLAGRDRRSQLEDALRQAGHAIVVAEVYEARAHERLADLVAAEIAAGRIDAVLHYSRRSAEIFLDLARAAGLSGAIGASLHICISAAAAAPLTAAALRTRVAASPDSQGLFAALDRV